MKKEVLYLIAAICTISAFAGCNKNETTPQTEAPVEVIVEYTVGERDDFGPDTKALKTEWASGDQILVLLEPEGETWLLGEEEISLKLTYNGTGWDETWTGSASDLPMEGEGVSVALIKRGTGNFYAIHHRGEVSIPSEVRSLMELTGYEGGEFMTYYGTYDVKQSMKTSNVTFSLGEVNLELDPNLFQVSVPTTGDNATLSIKCRTRNMMHTADDAQLEAYALKSGSLWFDAENSSMTIDECDYTKAAGVRNGDDMSYCFYATSDWGASASISKYKFLYHYNETSSYVYEKSVGADFYEDPATCLTAGYAYRLPDVSTW